MPAEVVHTSAQNRELLAMNMFTHPSSSPSSSLSGTAVVGDSRAMAVGRSRHADPASAAKARLDVCGGQANRPAKTSEDDLWGMRMSKEFVSSAQAFSSVLFHTETPLPPPRGDTCSTLTRNDGSKELTPPKRVRDLHNTFKAPPLSTIDSEYHSTSLECLAGGGEEEGEEKHQSNTPEQETSRAANISVLPRSPSRELRDSTDTFSFQNQTETNRAQEEPFVRYASLPVDTIATISSPSVNPLTTTTTESETTADNHESKNNPLAPTAVTVKPPTQSSHFHSSLSTDETLSRDTMGYNNDNATAPSIADSKLSDKIEDGEETRTVTSMASTRDDDDSTHRSLHSAADSPEASPAATPHLGSANAEAEPSLPVVSVVGTPSTVSTAPSTDDASFSLDPQFPMERLAARLENNMTDALKPNMVDALNRYHQRLSSWDMAQQQQQFYGNSEAETAFPTANIPPAYAPQHAPSPAWAHGPPALSQQHQQHHHQQAQMVASFREQHGYPPMGPNENRWQQPLRFGAGGPATGDHQHGYYTPRPGAPDGRSYRGTQQPLPPTPGSFPHYHMQQRKPVNMYSPAATPPRGGVMGRGQRMAQGPGPHQHSHRVQPMSNAPSHSPAGGGQRSPSEVLKTLLRKKACLYEPDTSRAVALVTWLVGRVLAMESGFFSRQQLQAGVHACVAEKIQSGVITRTKVNRCMQIILNSCFHYIIPRPDGTEENGEGFRGQFSAEVSDDTFLLKMLPIPWNDVVVDKATVIEAASTEGDLKTPKKGNQFETPQSSPRLDSTPAPEKNSPGRESADGDDADGKRAVLLCFNENVRHAEDVFRCHNEFIRDTAHASNLQLSSHEWQLFFGREAASVPFLWGNIGIPVPHLPDQLAAQTDALGMMTQDENKVFRTTWCAKRYDHDHELCGFAHVEVNGGWLRRNPSMHNYKDEMCPSVKTVRGKNGGVLIINECPKGTECECAHSTEEISYHARRYKSKTCNWTTRPGGCQLGDACPSFHPMDMYRFPKKIESRSPRHSRQQQHANKSVVPLHAGAPTLYASPAPLSRFEMHLHLPGLQNLFRRNCSVMRAHVESENPECCYSCFGDDAGISSKTKTEAEGRAQI